MADVERASGSVKVTGRTWYHTTLFNAFIIGGVGFMAPGLWNAMSALVCIMILFILYMRLANDMINRALEEPSPRTWSTQQTP